MTHFVAAFLEGIFAQTAILCVTVLIGNRFSVDLTSSLAAGDALGRIIVCVATFVFAPSSSPGLAASLIVAEIASIIYWRRRRPPRNRRKRVALASARALARLRAMVDTQRRVARPRPVFGGVS